MIPLSVEFRLTTSAAETNSSAPGRNAISCTWPNRAEYVDAIYQKKSSQWKFYPIIILLWFNNKKIIPIK